MNSSCILAIVLSWYPYTVVKDVKDSGTFSGVYLEILATASKKYNFCYNLKYSPARGFGVSKNGSFNGALGVIQRKEADVFITPAGYSQERFNTFDLSKVVNLDYHSIMYPFPTAEPDLAGFVKPFTFEIWIWLLLLSMLMTFIFSVVFAFSNFLQKKFYSESASNNVIFRSFRWLISGIIAQPSSYPIKLGPNRMIVGTWILMGFILDTVYKSNLKAMLTTPKLNIPFETLEEAANQNEVLFNINKNSVLDATIKNADEGTILNKFNELIVPVDFSIMENELAYLSSDTKNMNPLMVIDSANVGILQRAFSQNGFCTLTVMREKFFPVPIGITFQKNSTFTIKVNRVISGLKEAGILDFLKQSYLRNITYCKIRKGELNQYLRPLSLTDFLGVFSLLAAGITIASLVSLMEIIWKLF